MSRMDVPDVCACSSYSWRWPTWHQREILRAGKQAVLCQVHRELRKPRLRFPSSTLALIQVPADRCDTAVDGRASGDRASAGSLAAQTATHMIHTVPGTQVGPCRWSWRLFCLAIGTHGCFCHRTVHHDALRTEMFRACGTQGWSTYPVCQQEQCVGSSGCRRCPCRLRTPIDTHALSYLGMAYR